MPYNLNLHENALSDALDAIRDPAVVYGTAKLGGQTLQPGLDVRGLGRVNFPLTERDAEALQQLCTPLIQTGRFHAECRAFELPLSRVSFTNPAWHPAVDAAVIDICNILDVPAKSVTAHPRQLILQRPGGLSTYFGTARIPSALITWGTMAILLAADYKGFITIFHDGRGQRFDYGTDNAYQSLALGYFSACSPTFEPLISGSRLVLMFSLMAPGPRTRRFTVPRPLDPRDYQDLKAALVSWATGEFDYSLADEAFFVLKNDYDDGPVSSMADLRGADRVAARLLQRLAREGYVACSFGFLDYAYWRYNGVRDDYTTIDFEEFFAFGSGDADTCVGEDENNLGANLLAGGGPYEIRDREDDDDYFTNRRPVFLLNRRECKEAGGGGGEAPDDPSSDDLGSSDGEDSSSDDDSKSEPAKKAKSSQR